MSTIPSRTVTVSLDPILVEQSRSQDDEKVTTDQAATPPYQLSIDQVVAQYEADTEAGLTDAAERV
ncbi:hypothetical protein GSI_05747 [Ganoderma sinense ZZ0214-1]|uniref:Uncharacterized protein n=1 Tax=Ganoderma sinense ZZ0214-1 TaxID=1077348 RepID=A0A2G8SBC3_9APHY|nr:hypothetical protein GSI_05747 [Ganoderma sinense ZZ0214-1]